MASENYNLGRSAVESAYQVAPVLAQMPRRPAALPCCVSMDATASDTAAWPNRRATMRDSLQDYFRKCKSFALNRGTEKNRIFIGPPTAVNECGTSLGSTSMSPA